MLSGNSGTKVRKNFETGDVSVKVRQNISERFSNLFFFPTFTLR